MSVWKSTRVSLQKKDDVMVWEETLRWRQLVVHPNDIPKFFNNMGHSLKDRLGNYPKEVSKGANQTLGLYLNIHKYNALKASSYIKLPHIIKNKTNEYWI